MRALDNRVENVIGMLVTGQRRGHIEMHGRPAPMLRDNADKTHSAASFVTDPGSRRSNSVAMLGPGFLLQASFPQYGFERGDVADQACPRHIGGKRVREIALDRRFPVRRMASVTGWPWPSTCRYIVKGRLRRRRLCSAVISVMGDVVLTENEVNPVMAKLAAGIEIQASV